MPILRRLFVAVIAVYQSVYGKRLISERVEELDGKINLLRMLMSGLYCREDANPPDFMTGTGAWCIRPDRQFAGRPLGDLHFMDPGIGPLLGEWLAGRRVVDLGAGSGQYGTQFEIQRANISYAGFDGALNVVEFTDGRIAWADLTAPLLLPDGPADWALSLEVSRLCTRPMQPAALSSTSRCRLHRTTIAPSQERDARGKPTDAPRSRPPSYSSDWHTQVGEHIPATYEHKFLANVNRSNICGAILSWAVPGQLGHGHVNTRTNEYIIERMGAMGYEYDAVAAGEGRAVAHLGWFKNTFMVFRRKDPSAKGRPECELKGSGRRKTDTAANNNSATAAPSVVEG